MRWHNSVSIRRKPTPGWRESRQEFGVTQQDVRIPDIGGAEDVEVIEILVKPGSMIETNDPLIVIESDKASMEVPATVSGKLLKIAVALGDKVHEDQVIAVVEVDGA